MPHRLLRLSEAVYRPQTAVFYKALFAPGIEGNAARAAQQRERDFGLAVNEFSAQLDGGGQITVALDDEHRACDRGDLAP